MQTSTGAGCGLQSKETDKMKNSMEGVEQDGNASIDAQKVKNKGKKTEV